MGTYRIQNSGYISSPSTQITPGSANQFLRTNAAGTAAEWVSYSPTAEKVTLTEASTWTDQQTITGDWEDITNATVTISGLDNAKTYDVKCDASLEVNVANSGALRLDIGGTVVNSKVNETGDWEFVSLTGMKLSVTGVTSIVCKLQGKAVSGNLIAGFSGYTHAINAIAVEQ